MEDQVFIHDTERSKEECQKKIDDVRLKHQSELPTIWGAFMFWGRTPTLILPPVEIMPLIKKRPKRMHSMKWYSSRRGKNGRSVGTSYRRAWTQNSKGVNGAEIEK